MSPHKTNSRAKKHINRYYNDFKKRKAQKHKSLKSNSSLRPICTTSFGNCFVTRLYINLAVPFLTKSSKWYKPGLMCHQMMMYIVHSRLTWTNRLVKLIWAERCARKLLFRYQWPFKIIDFCTIRKPTYDFLLVIILSLAPITISYSAAKLKTTPP